MNKDNFIKKWLVLFGIGWACFLFIGLSEILLRKILSNVDGTATKAFSLPWILFALWLLRTSESDNKNAKAIIKFIASIGWLALFGFIGWLVVSSTT